MKIALFYHSLLSDWNHGNAHFLRGVASELVRRGHQVKVLEPADGWSLSHLIADHGEHPIEDFRRAYPGLESVRYDSSLDLPQVLENTDLVLVHEWNDPVWVSRIGAHHKARGGYRLLFHDTHHRSVTEPEKLSQYDLSGYDGVLAYGKAIAAIYLTRRWARRAWTWHEAADIRVFRPLPGAPNEGDLIWIGNWGDGEREAELQEFLIEPAKALSLKARIYGVRYSERARAMLRDAGIEYAGWLANFRVAEMFSRFRVTVHVPRSPYGKSLPGIPTIRPFEALACGIPLLCSPWDDSDCLFTEGKDYLVARNGAEMRQLLAAVLNDPKLAAGLAAHGRATILERHTCAHRVDQLLQIVRDLETAQEPPGAASAHVTGAEGNL